MWVRSQNKEILINTNKFFINQVVKDCEIIGYSIDSGGIELGKYTTKEQALKVLNEIEVVLSNASKRISKVQYLLKENGHLEDYDIKENVFQMPQDWSE